MADSSPSIKGNVVRISHDTSAPSFAVRNNGGGTSGGGGGDGMESRVTRLESDLEHVKSNVADIKSGFRLYIGVGVTLLLAAAASVGTLYLHINSSASALEKSLHKSSMANAQDMATVTREVESLKGDIKLLDAKVGDVADRLGPLINMLERSAFSERTKEEQPKSNTN